MPVSVMVAFGIVLVFLFFGLFGNLVAPFDPDLQDLALGASGPSGAHWLGTDQLGRDVFSRLIVATGAALAGPFVVAIATVLAGATLGLIAGYFGGRTDAIISRAADLIWSVPGLLVAIVVIGVLQGGLWLTVAVIAFISSPHAIRQTRSATLAQVGLPYVAAARTMGLSDARIIFRHLLPNVRATIITTAMLDFVTAILVFAALAFLRIGVEPGVANWGTMLADGQTLITVNLAVIAAPAVAIVAVAASITVIGDGRTSAPLARRTGERRGDRAGAVRDPGGAPGSRGRVARHRGRGQIAPSGSCAISASRSPPARRSAIVGESGSGKSLTAKRAHRPAAEDVRGDRHASSSPARNLLERRESASCAASAAATIALVMQDPFTILNPIMQCGAQCHRSRQPLARRARAATASGARREVGSGGSARSAVDPPSPSAAVPALRRDASARRHRGRARRATRQLLIADEPSTALDVTHAERDPRAAAAASSVPRGMSLILITHDLRCRLLDLRPRSTCSTPARSSRLARRG